MRDDLDGLEAEVDAFLQTREDGRFSITETGALTIAIHAVTRSKAARALSAHPAILGLCADLIGPDVRLYWDQAVYKKTEKPRRVPWHQDNGYTYVEPQEYLTVWLALTDATSRTAARRWRPAATGGARSPTTTSIRSGGSASRRAPRRWPRRWPAGGAVVFSSLTPHRTGPNLTDEVRKAYILQYCPSDAEILRGDPAEGPAVEPGAVHRARAPVRGAARRHRRTHRELRLDRRGRRRLR